MSCATRRLRKVLLGLAWLAVAACGPGPEAPDALPAGHGLIARTEALARLLDSLQHLERTPVARRAAALAAALPDCAWVEAAVADGDAAELFSRLHCRQDASALPALEARRGDRDLVFALAGDGGAHTVGGLRVFEDGSVHASFDLPRQSFADARGLLLPAAEAPGPTLLSHREEIAHARLRPRDGLDIASLVPAGSQGDELFQLKSRLFAGAVLDGSWEAVVYLPAPGDSVPRAALAVGFSLAEPAVTAMEGFIGELEDAWPVRRSPFALGAARGACLLELNLLPGLAPCYVAVEDALVVGWNPASVRAALADDGGAQPHPEGGVTAFLERIPEADARLAREAGAPAPAAVALPWRRLFLDGTSEGGRVRVRLELATGAGA